MTMSEMTVMTMKKAWIVIERPKLKIASVCGGYREDLSVDIDDSTRYTAKKQIRICECIEGLKRPDLLIRVYNTKNTPSMPSQSKEYAKQNNNYAISIKSQNINLRCFVARQILS